MAPRVMFTRYKNAFLPPSLLTQSFPVVPRAYLLLIVQQSEFQEFLIYHASSVRSKAREDKQ